MYIYVATSWRNQFQPKVVNDLRDAGHDVYDFRGEGSFSWMEIDPFWVSWSRRQYLTGLEHPCALRGFKRDMNALEKCDACVYVMPCGPSASMEMGYCVGANKLTIVYIPQLKEPDLMVKMADLVTDNFLDVLERLNEYAMARRAKHGLR